MVAYAKTFDTWGEPIYSNTDAMQGPGQISEAVKLAMARGVRHFATQAALNLATGMQDGYLAVVDTIRGGLFVYDGIGAAWVMTGIAQFATATARDSAITAPVAGMLARTLDTGNVWRYTGTAWRWYSGAVRAQMKRSSDLTLTANTFVPVSFTTAEVLDGIDWSAGVNPSQLKAKIAGNYLLTGTQNQINSTANGDVTARINGSGSLSPFFSVANASGAAVVTWQFSIYLAVGDYVEVLARSNGAFPWIAANRVCLELLGGN